MIIKLQFPCDLFAVAKLDRTKDVHNTDFYPIFASIAIGINYYLLNINPLRPTTNELSGTSWVMVHPCDMTQPLPTLKLPATIIVPVPKTQRLPILAPGNKISSPTMILLSPI